MNFNILNEITKTIEQTKENFNWNKLLGGGIVENEEIELAQKLNAIEEFSVDRFENEIAILENRVTGDKKNIEKSRLPKEIREGSILKCINGKYIYDEELTKEQEKRIEQEMDNLWD